MISAPCIQRYMISMPLGYLIPNLIEDDMHTWSKLSYPRKTSVRHGPAASH
jgi:hypothetical protein